MVTLWSFTSTCTQASISWEGGGEGRGGRREGGGEGGGGREEEGGEGGGGREEEGGGEGGGGREEEEGGGEGKVTLHDIALTEGQWEGVGGG